jgi:hypothetical protein
MIAAALWGAGLIDALLPVAAKLILWLDERFAILLLSIDHTTQDTVVRLRVSLTQIVTVGGVPTRPDPRGWLEVTTTTGAMLQSLVIACTLATGWPAQWRVRLARLMLAAALGLVFLMVDLPVTLHAYVWDMFVYHYDPQVFSPLLAWHEAMQQGGRPGVGILIGVIVISRLVRV